MRLEMAPAVRKRKVGALDLLEVPGDPDVATIILLHGYGSNALDLLPLSDTYVGPTWVFPQGPLRIPFSPAYTGNAWFPVNIPLLSHAVQEKEYSEIIKAFPFDLQEPRLLIERLLTELALTPPQVILGGFSQGAILSIETVLHSQQPFAGLVIFSGALINEKRWIEEAPHHTSTPFFQSHGTEDTILPLVNARGIAELLTTGGLSGDLHIFPGGHTIPPSIQKKFAAFLEQIYSK